MFLGYGQYSSKRQNKFKIYAVGLKYSSVGRAVILYVGDIGLNPQHQKKNENKLI